LRGQRACACSYLSCRKGSSCFFVEWLIVFVVVVLVVVVEVFVLVVVSFLFFHGLGGGALMWLHIRICEV